MLLTTPDTIRTLQRKLYVKRPSNNRPTAFTRSTTSCIGQTYSVMPGGWSRPTREVLIL